MSQMRGGQYKFFANLWRCFYGATILFYWGGGHARADIQDTTTFASTVPFTCSFSGGSDLVEMDFTRNGNSGIMSGTSDSLMVQANLRPRIQVALNTILAPHNIYFRGVWVRSASTGQTIQSKHSSSISNAPISTIIPVSKLNQHGFVANQSYGLKLTTSASLLNSYPFDEYRFEVVLTCLEP